MAGGTGDQAKPADFSALAVSAGKSWSDATEKIRQRTDTTAKTIGGLGTIGITAAGLDKFSDIFPLSESPSVWQLLAVLGVLGGVVGMAAGVVFFTIRLLKVSSPIFFRFDPAQMDDVDEIERAKIRTIFEDAAELNDATTFEIYAYRALRLQRVAQRSSNVPARALAEAEANEINSDVSAAQARAAANVVRRRSQDAFLGKDAWKPYALFIASLLAFGVGADYLDSERTARVTAAQDCAEAIKAVRDSAPATAKLLPALCGGPEAASAESDPANGAASNPETELAGAVKDLAARYNACVAAARTASANCTTINAALKAALP